jgi:hypothetical protein
VSLPRELLGLLLTPETWAWLLPVLAFGLLFVLSLVRRRHPGALPLLVLGAALGSTSARLLSPQDVTARALESSTLSWVMLAVCVVLAALLQPGEVAPLRMGRAARHLLPVLVGCLLLGVWVPEVAWLGMPFVLVALGAGRASPRVDSAWLTANQLLAAHASALFGILLVDAFFEEADRLLLAFAGAVSVQALAGHLELGRAPRLRGYVLLLILGGAVRVGRYPSEALLLWHARGVVLPLCRDPAPLPDSAWVAPPQRLPAWFFELEERPVLEIVVILDQDEPLGRLAEVPRDTRRSIQLACRSRATGRYGVFEIHPGSGVDVRQTEGATALADGSPLPGPGWEPPRGCSHADALGLRRDVTAGMAAAWCEDRICRTGELCTWSEARGWHIEGSPWLR